MSTHGPGYPRVASPRKVAPPRRSSSSSSTSSYVATAPPVGQHSVQQLPDPFYGHEEIAKLCARYVSQLFSCPEIPPPSAGAANPVLPILAQFIAYALHRTRLHVCVTFTALFLLQRLKNRFPAARGSSGHRLFISAFMIASKVVCDDTYSNKSWCVVGQGMFSLKEINQMEREMCGYLEWHLNVNTEDLEKFEREVRRDFGAAAATAHHPRPTLSIATKSSPHVSFKGAEAPPTPPQTPPMSTLRSATPSPTVCTPPSVTGENDTAVVASPRRKSSYGSHRDGGAVSPFGAKARERSAAFATVEASQW